jgi:hypothetical protein
MKMRPGRVGCARGCAIGCAALVVLMIAGAAFLGPQIRSSLRGALGNESQWIALAQSWQPPTTVDPESLFPPVVGMYRRERQAEVPSLPDLGIRTKGGHAVYNDDQATVDLYVFPNAGSDPETLLDGIEAAVEAKQKEPGSAGYRVSGRFNYELNGIRISRMGFKSGPPDRSGLLVGCSGCLLVARTESGTNLDSFLRSYLAAPRP